MKEKHTMSDKINIKRMKSGKFLVEFVYKDTNERDKVIADLQRHVIYGYRVQSIKDDCTKLIFEEMNLGINANLDFKADAEKSTLDITDTKWTFKDAKFLADFSCRLSCYKEEKNQVTGSKKEKKSQIMGAKLEFLVDGKNEPLLSELDNIDGQSMLFFRQILLDRFMYNRILPSSNPSRRVRNGSLFCAPPNATDSIPIPEDAPKLLPPQTESLTHTP